MGIVICASAMKTASWQMPARVSFQATPDTGKTNANNPDKKAYVHPRLYCICSSSLKDCANEGKFFVEKNGSDGRDFRNCLVELLIRGESLHMDRRLAGPASDHLNQPLRVEGTLRRGGW